MDAAGQCAGVNRAWSQFTGRPEVDALGLGLAADIHPDDAATCHAVHAAALASGLPFRAEYRLRHADGTFRRVLAEGSPVDGSAVAPEFLIAVMDVTDVASVAREERDVLLKELHHRVKNNAQATTSFLGLQANRATDPAVAAALRSAAVRVMLATLVQDRMFRVGPQERVDIGLELERTARSALDIAGRPGLRLETRIQQGIGVPVPRATPLGLIVNELVVNAVRHAFPDRPTGAVSLEVRRDGPEEMEISVADDGVGLPAALPRNTPQGALGLHLMPQLARQAGAQFRLEGGVGTRAVLRMPVG